MCDILEVSTKNQRLINVVDLWYFSTGFSTDTKNCVGVVAVILFLKICSKIRSLYVVLDIHRSTVTTTKSFFRYRQANTHFAFKEKCLMHERLKTICFYMSAGNSYIVRCAKDTIRWSHKGHLRLLHVNTKQMQRRSSHGSANFCRR